MPLSRALDMPDAVLADTLTTLDRTPAVTDRPTGPVFAQPLAPMLTAGAMVILVVLAISWARSADMIVAMWAAGGVAVAMWLRSGRGWSYDLSFGGLIAMGILAGEFLAGNSPAMSLMFTLANMTEIIAAVILARRFAPTLSFASVEGAFRFLLATAMIAPIPAALLASLILSVTNGAPFLSSFQTWWFGHALGFAVITPMLLSIDRRTALVFRQPGKMVEWVGLLGGLTAFAWFNYFQSSVPLGFLANPILVVIAVRLRVGGIAAAMIIMVLFGVGSVLFKPAPMAVNSLADRAMLAQLAMLLAYVPFLLVAALLNERDRLSERARAGQRRAERASEAKSRLLANVAHEIKSPVGGVIGIGQLWSTGQLGAVTATQKEMAEMLVKTARQVETLAHDLLDVARAESGAVKVELRPVDVAGVLEDVRRATVLRTEAQGVTLEVICEDEGLIVLADSQRLTQVIDNLATNAVKYGAAGGVVSFRARRLYDGVRIEVTDRGPGLSLEKQAQLFEPFNRLGLERSAVEGHGIGLALAKRMVELQGGSIGVTSAPGEGATFWIELPGA